MKNRKRQVHHWLLVIGLHALTYTCAAHGDLHERIQEATKVIQAFPDSAFLYVERGKLYFQHEDFERAIVDLQQATELGHQGEYSNLIFAKSYYQLKKNHQALLYIEDILATAPNHIHALKVKGSILFAQKKYKEAALVFEKVIRHARRTLPENYLEASKAWELAGRSNKAIAIVEKGIASLSPLFVFQDRLKTLYIKNHDFEGALAIQHKIIAAANRKEFAYQEAANLCLHFQYPQQAKNYLHLSLAAIAQLPPRIQSSKNINKLKQRLTRQLGSL